MVSLSLFSNRSGRSLRGKTATAGFTFVEVMMGVTVLALTATVVLFALNQLNYYATASRLYTAAQTLAQNQIDLILTKGPYDPAAGAYPSPNILATNTQVANGATYTYYSDPTTPSVLYTTARPVTIYKDPMNNNKVVEGTIETRIKDTGTTVTVGTTTSSLDLRQATVTVAYKFRGRDYKIVMETLRTSDK